MSAPKRHHVYRRPRGDLWIGHLADRDRTTERIELGERAFWATRSTARRDPCTDHRPLTTAQEGT